jgi:hypothetical protein
MLNALLERYCGIMYSWNMKISQRRDLENASW